MYVGVMQSESKEWVALGNTEEEVLEAIRRKWNKVQRIMKQNGGINREYIYANVNDLNDDYGVSIYELNPGECDYMEEGSDLYETLLCCISFRRWDAL